MSQRHLVTGQRQGRMIVLMEIEKRNSEGGYDVIAFCFACRKPKRMKKGSWTSAYRLGAHCGCQRGLPFNDTRYKDVQHPFDLGGKGRPRERQRARYGTRALRGIK